ncbi:hydrogenase [Tsukamurella soli]|uniref:hydrogenase n=1 Tax=Tsukamurella soli TaxID=644556 RepID=UPI0036204B03
MFDGTANTVAVLVLLLEFGMLRSALLRAQVRLYAAQSFTLSVLAAVVAAGRGIPELYALAGLSFLLKVIVVPAVVYMLLRDASEEIAGSGALGVASEVLVSIAVAGFGFFAVGVLGVQSRVLPVAALSLSVAVVLVAFVLMILRRDVVSQAIGFFSRERRVAGQPGGGGRYAADPRGGFPVRPAGGGRRVRCADADPPPAVAVPVHGVPRPAAGVTACSA